MPVEEFKNQIDDLTKTILRRLLWEYALNSIDNLDSAT